jgi:RND family efflux transporter MFP subunit
MRIAINALLAVAVLAGAGGLVHYLLRTKPEAERQETGPVATLVTVQAASPADVRVVVPAMGTVGPAQSVVLQPQVTGQIVEESANMRRGGRFAEGEVMLRIDPRDYELAVRQAQAGVERAEFDLRVEQGRQTIARREWAILEEDLVLSEADRDLALRQPHLRNAQAALDAAKSSLEQAQLALERTTIRAPFNCLVLRDFVDVGQLVSPQAQIAEAVGTDEAWVQVAVPVERLELIDVPDQDAGGPERGSPARVVYATGSAGTTERQGHVLCICGDVEPAGRMARLLVAVEDPFGLNPKNGGVPLLQSAYVRVEIQGPVLHDVFVLPRSALREGGQVWVMGDDGRLEVRDVSIAWRREGDVVVSDGLSDGDLVVTSMIPTPIPGMALRTADDGSIEEGEAARAATSAGTAEDQAE